MNGAFPGPTLKARRGDKMIIEVYNRVRYNITLHWYVASEIKMPAEYVELFART